MELTSVEKDGVVVRLIALEVLTDEQDMEIVELPTFRKLPTGLCSVLAPPDALSEDGFVP